MSPGTSSTNRIEPSGSTLARLSIDKQFHGDLEATSKGEMLSAGTQGAPQLVVSVVPDSGTGELVGLAGTVQIDIASGKHSYVFEYTLPLTPN